MLRVGNLKRSIAFYVDDVYQAVKVAKLKSAEVIREATNDAGTTIVAFLKDLDGYEIELLSKKNTIKKALHNYIQNHSHGKITPI